MKILQIQMVVTTTSGREILGPKLLANRAEDIETLEQLAPLIADANEDNAERDMFKDVLAAEDGKFVAQLAAGGVEYIISRNIESIRFEVQEDDS